MSAIHKAAAPPGGYGGACKVEEGAVSDQFPAGLRVLVVDDDTSCLRILEQMLRKCNYHVTTCCRARIALSLLREKKGGFDLVISDVHMPDMDGFKLLELVGLEMDLPVIMMSADGRTSAVMKGIKHGACDYLIKPVRMEELKNIWQHVVRKKWNENKEHEHSSSLDDSDRQRRGAEEDEHASSVNDGNDVSYKVQKRKKEAKDDEDDGDMDNDDSSAAKKPRVVWSVELHQQFVSAVNQLGIDKAVPKRILELMNVPGLTRENVASHLQKFRLYLKRLSGVTQPQGGLPNSFCAPVEPSSKANALGRLDFQAMHIPSHAMTALHAELLGRPSGTMMLSDLDPLHTGGRYPPAERGIAFGQPIVKCQSSLPKMFPQTNMVLGDMSSSFASWSPNLLVSSSPTSNTPVSINLPNGNMLAQQMALPQQSQSILSESSNAINMQQEAHAINVQPSCLISPSQTLDGYNIPSTVNSINTQSALPSVSSVFQDVVAPVPVVEDSGLNDVIQMADYSLLSHQVSNLSPDLGKLPDGDYKSVPLLSEYSVPGSVPSISPDLLGKEGTSSWNLQNSASNFTCNPSSYLPGFVVNLSNNHNSAMNKGFFPSQGQVKNFGYVGRGASIPSRFAVDDIDSPGDNFLRKEMNYNDNGGRVRQEIHLDFVDGSKVESAPMAHSSSSDPMSILSK